jgi:hypothetical protein
VVVAQGRQRRFRNLPFEQLIGRLGMDLPVIPAAETKRQFPTGADVRNLGNVAASNEQAWPFADAQLLRLA